jgi:hypothetical protein
MLGFSKLLGYYSNPAYAKVFLKATPSTRKDSYFILLNKVKYSN